jgi:hypothetical protein
MKPTRQSRPTDFCNRTEPQTRQTTYPLARFLASPPGPTPTAGQIRTKRRAFLKRRAATRPISTSTFTSASGLGRVKTLSLTTGVEKRSLDEGVGMVFMDVRSWNGRNSEIISKRLHRERVFTQPGSNTRSSELPPTHPICSAMRKSLARQVSSKKGATSDPSTPPRRVGHRFRITTRRPDPLRDHLVPSTIRLYAAGVTASLGA